MSIIDIKKLTKEQQTDIQQFYNKIRSYDIDKNVVDEIFSEIVGFDCMNIKTWEDLVEHNLEECLECSTVSDMIHAFQEERSANALMKIQYLIKHVYGGLPDNPWSACTFVCWDINENKPYLDSYMTCVHVITPIRFRCEEQAKDFISYPENVELIMQFYNIPVERLNH